jgi:hypothetical protein
MSNPIRTLDGIQIGGQRSKITLERPYPPWWACDVKYNHQNDWLIDWMVGESQLYECENAREWLRL